MYIVLNVAWERVEIGKRKRQDMLPTISVFINSGETKAILKTHGKMILTEHICQQKP